MDERRAKANAEAGGWTVAIAATLGMTVSYIDRQTLAVIAPAVRAALHIDHKRYGLLVSAFSLAYLVGAPAAGVVVDRLGARRGFALAVVVWSFVAGAHALAMSFASLFALRVLLGAAEAPSFPAAAQAIRRAFPGARRSAAYGLLFTGSSLGAMIAAPLAVAIEARLGFRYAFLITAAVGTAWLPLWLTVTAGGRLGPEPRATPVPTASPPPRWRDVVLSAPVLRAIVAIAGSAPALMFVLLWTSQYLVEGWKIPKENIGGYLVLAPLLFDVGAIGFGWLASTREMRPTSSDGPRTHVDLILVSATLAACLALAPLAPSPGIAVALCAASACGGGGIYVLVTADMLSRVPKERTSAAGGMTAAAQSLAHIIAGPLVGKSVDDTHSYSPTLVVLGLVVIPTSLAFVFWPGIRRRQAT